MTYSLVSVVYLLIGLVLVATSTAFQKSFETAAQPESIHRIEARAPPKASLRPPSPRSSQSPPRKRAKSESKSQSQSATLVSSKSDSPEPRLQVQKSSSHSPPSASRKKSSRSRSESPPKMIDLPSLYSLGSSSSGRSSSSRGSEFSHSSGESQRSLKSSRQAGMSTRFTGAAVRPYIRTPEGGYQLGSGRADAQHPQQVEGGAIIKKSGTAGGNTRARAVTIATGDTAEAMVWPSRESRGAHLQIPAVGGGKERQIFIKPGNKHTHNVSNSGEGKPLRLVAALDGPGELNSKARILPKKD